MNVRDCPSYPCPTPEQAKDCNDCPCDYCPKPSTVDLGLRERSQRGEAQTGQCPPGFEEYCVLESGEACPNYRDGRCSLIEEAQP